MSEDFTVRPRTLALLVLTAFGLVLGGGFIQDLYVYSQSPPRLDSKFWLIDVDVEQSIYTGMSVILIAFCSVLLFVIGSIQLGEQNKYAYHWLILSLIFAFLAADEFLSMHEKLSGFLGARFNPSSAVNFAWIVPTILLLISGLIAFIPFLKAQPKKIGAGMLAAGVIFALGAVGMEILASSYLADGNLQTLPYRLLVTAEEGLEGLGMILFMWALLEKLAGRTLRIEGTAPLTA